VPAGDPLHGNHEILLEEQPLGEARWRRADRQNRNIEPLRVELRQNGLPDLARRPAVMLRHELQKADVDTRRLACEAGNERSEKDGRQRIRRTDRVAALRVFRIEWPCR
jgi:hypothetical protein